MNGPLRRVEEPQQINESGGGRAWLLTLSCGHEVIRPVRDPEPPLTARCMPQCSISRVLYGRHKTPDGLLFDKKPVPVQLTPGFSPRAPHEGLAHADE